MIAKMTVVIIVIIQPHQNETLKAYSTLLAVIQLHKRFKFTKKGITNPQFRNDNTKTKTLIQTIPLKYYSLHKTEEDYGRLKPYLLNVKKYFDLLHHNSTNSDLVQKMQTNSIVISNFNSLCYGIEPRVNKEISFNLLENTLTLFMTVRSFFYAKNIKRKHKIKSNKSKSPTLWR